MKPLATIRSLKLTLEEFRVLKYKTLFPLAIAYSCLFTFIDWMSYVHPFGDLNITPWNPPAALEVLLLTWRGISWTPWVYLTLAFSDWLIRDSSILSASVIIGNLVLVVCYTTISRILSTITRRKPYLYGREDVAKLCAVSVMGAALTAFSYISTQTLIGNVTQDEFFEATYRFFVGDLLGFIVILPLFLLLIDQRRRQQFTFMFHQRSFWILIFGLFACIGFVFSLPIDQQATYFFPFFFAVGLIGAAHSLPGATLAAAFVQIPLIWSATQAGVAPSTLIDMQIVMLTLSLTGLIIGTVVDERLKIQEELKESLQLVAAGELAGSLAHELNQPMNALNAYAESALIISSLPSDSNGEKIERLRSVLKQITHETMRASDIVRGLRSFFIDGASSMLRSDINLLATDCCELLNAHSKKHNVDLIFVDSEENLFSVIDQTQLRTALGNVIKNAIEAAGVDKVIVKVQRAAGGRVEILVFDTGTLLNSVEEEKIFKPFFSTKKSGLGLGLSISKALIENNDGSLEYFVSPQKHFRISLPVD